MTVAVEVVCGDMGGRNRHINVLHRHRGRGSRVGGLIANYAVVGDAKGRGGPRMTRIELEAQGL